MSRRNYLAFTILFLAFASCASASDDVLPPKKMIWPFDGTLGKVDRVAAQRGFQVYREVCASCHGLRLLYYRNLKDIGFSDDEVKEIARSYTVVDGPNDEGEMFERPAIHSDGFVSPYPNEQAARAVNNGALPPDLSLMVKARADGANYIYSLLTGYSAPPSNFDVQDGLYYNPYFSGKQIAMAPPLMTDQVTYMDGTRSSVEQMSRDVTIFLQWTAEPEMEQRKSLGLKTILFLSVLTYLFYILNKKIWRRKKS